MNQQARDAYLEAQVLTATPQKLRLMLIDGAIRFARLAVRHWDLHEDDLASEALIRCRTVVAELLASIKLDESPLPQRVASLYAFLYSHLTQAHACRDRRRVEEVIEVLLVDRETWWLMCEQLPAGDGPVASSRGLSPEIVAPPLAIPDASATGANVRLDA